MKVDIKYPKAKCSYCGKTFTKQHGNQKYCSYNCKHNAKKEQVAHSRLRNYYKNKEQGKISIYGLGTGSLGQHRNTDTDREQEIITREKQRLGI